MVEVAISSLVLVVALSGLVITTIYTRNLSQSSKHLWQATSAASSTLEQIRHQSVTNWGDISSWNGMHCDYGVGDAIDPYAAKLAADVSDDAATLDRATGMWTAGSPTPNFYFVQVHATDSKDEFANALDFQTYVADRKGIKDLLDANKSTDVGGGSVSGGGTGGTGGNTDTGTNASYITTTPANVAMVNAGPLHTLSYTLNNGSTNGKVVTSAVVTSTKTTTVGSFTLNGVSLFNNPAKAASTISINGVNSLLTSLLPGPITLAFSSPKASFASQTVTVKLTFADGSSTTSSVKP